MRVLPALSGSVIAHLALIAILREMKPPAPPPATARPPPITLVEPAPAAEPMPIEIVVVPRAAEPAPAATAEPPRSVAGPSHPSVTRSRATTPVETGAATHPGTEPDPAAPGTHLLAMRDLRHERRERTPMTVDGDALGRIANERPAEAVAPVPESGKLRPSGGGAMIAPDLQVPMHVDPDGTPRFDRHPSDGEIHAEVPTTGEQLGHLIDDWYKDPYAQLDAPPVQELPPHEQAVPGGWDSGGRPGSLAGETAKNGTVPVAGGGFDITSWVMKKAGIDPYRARKQKLLEETYDERAGMRAVHTGDQLRRSAELMRTNLTRLWRATTDPAARRQALFELWDECTEGDGPAGEAGERARTQVLGWIRKRLPAGSTDAYSVDEITRLNANRQSTQAFAPYQ